MNAAKPWRSARSRYAGIAQPVSATTGIPRVRRQPSADAEFPPVAFRKFQFGDDDSWRGVGGDSMRLGRVARGQDLESQRGERIDVQVSIVIVGIDEEHDSARCRFGIFTTLGTNGLRRTGSHAGGHRSRDFGARGLVA